MRRGGAGPWAPSLLHAAHVGFAASSLHPAQLPAYLPEPRGEEHGSKPKPEPGDGRAVGRMEPSVRGVAEVTAFHGLAARVSGATRLPTAPLPCSPLFPRQTHAPSAHPTVQPCEERCWSMYAPSAHSHTRAHAHVLPEHSTASLAETIPCSQPVPPPRMSCPPPEAMGLPPLSQ